MSGPTAVGARRVDRRPVLLLVDNRVSDFTQYVLNRRDVSVVLLRFDEFADTVPHWPPWGRLPRSWRDETRHVPSFDVSAKRSLEDEAQRYRRWVSASPVVPTWFCNPEEHVQEIGHRFAALVGLPHLDGEQVAWVRDKVAMKQRFTQLGIPTAAHRAVDQPVESVLSFATEHGWPVVLKPVDSFATIDTHLVRDADQLRRLAPGLPDRRWMVEEYVPGREYQVCALVAGSRVLDVYLSLNPHPLLQTLSGAMNADVTVGRGCGEYAIQPAVTRLVQRVVAGMRIARGYVHLEVFLRDDGSLCLSKVAARLAGCGSRRTTGWRMALTSSGRPWTPTWAACRGCRAE